MYGRSYSPYGRRTMPPSVPVVVYGTPWCGMTMMIRRYLDRLGMPYRFVNLDAYPEERERLNWLAGGRVSTPVVYAGGELLVQPSVQELQWALSRAGVRSY